MPKHETRNIFYSITSEVNLVCSCHITKENVLATNSRKNMAWKLVPGPFAFIKN